MVEPLWDGGKSSVSFAIFELVAHRAYQKAALLARALVAAHPECKTLIIEFGPEMAAILLEADLLKLPNS